MQSRLRLALDVLIDRAKLEELDAREQDALTIFKGHLAEVRKIKTRERDKKAAG